MRSHLRAAAAGAGSERLDLTDDVRAEPMRELVAKVGEPAPRPEIDVIDGDGAHADPHLARSGLGQLDRRALEDLGPAVGANDHGFGLHAPKVLRAGATRAFRAGGRPSPVTRRAREPA